MHTKTNNAIFALASRVREYANHHITEALREKGIEDILPVHGSVFHILFEQKSCSLSELATRLKRKKSTITNMIKYLESQGYCERRADEDDARIQWISLTAKGEAMRALHEEISRKLLKRAWKGLTEADQETLCLGLARVIENLKTSDI